MDIYYKQSDIAAALSVLMLSSWALECNGTRAAGIQEALHLIQDMINGEVPENMKIPAADVKPVVLGWWVNEPDRYRHWHCSECGYTISGIEIAYYYCPNCGADMREVE